MNRMRALVVDPDEVANRLVADRLRAIGCEQIAIVRDGESGLRAANKHRADIDLVLLELELPDMDGVLACRRLGAMLAGVPIIACCRRTDDETFSQAYEAGAHDFIAKPFRVSELCVRARAALRIRAERRLRVLHDHWLHGRKRA